jgi:hypothetical protein
LEEGAEDARLRDLEVLIMKDFVKRPAIRTIIVTVFYALASTFVAVAHHSLNAEFDRTRETQYRATVTSFEWTNPHASFHAKVEGSSEVWIFELPSPSGLERYGWTTQTLHADDSVVISAFPARAPAARASVHRLTLGNGRIMEIDHPFAKPLDR